MGRLPQALHRQPLGAKNVVTSCDGRRNGSVMIFGVPQGFRVHVQLLTQPPERRPRLGLPIQPNRPLAQLIGVLPRCWSTEPWLEEADTDVCAGEHRVEGSCEPAVRPRAS